MWSDVRILWWFFMVLESLNTWRAVWWWRLYWYLARDLMLKRASLVIATLEPLREWAITIHIWLLCQSGSSQTFVVLESLNTWRAVWWGGRLQRSVISSRSHILRDKRRSTATPLATGREALLARDFPTHPHLDRLNHLDRLLAGCIDIWRVTWCSSAPLWL